MVENPPFFSKPILSILSGIQTVGSLVTLTCLCMYCVMINTTKVYGCFVTWQYIPEVDCFNGRAKVIGEIFLSSCLNAYVLHSHYLHNHHHALLMCKSGADVMVCLYRYRLMEPNSAQALWTLIPLQYSCPQLIGKA